MAIIYKTLKDPAYISDSAGAIVTCPSAKVDYLKTIVLHNTDTAAITVTLYKVKNSTGSVGTASAANQIFKRSIDADETFILHFPEQGVLLEEENDTLQAVAGTASKVVIDVEGGEE